MELKSKHLWRVVDFWEETEPLESIESNSQRWVIKAMVSDLRALEALVAELQAERITEQATTPAGQAEAAMRPLWDDDKVFDVVSTAADKSRVEDHLLEGDGAAIMFRMRDDYETALATVKAERDEALAQLASLNKFIDDTLREMVKGEDE